jgi:hypothetical protein
MGRERTKTRMWSGTGDGTSLTRDDRRGEDDARIGEREEGGVSAGRTV